MMPKVQSVCNAEDIAFLETFCATYNFTSTLLPIKSVGVQGDCRSYSYVVGLSEDAPADESEAATTAKFETLARMAKLIPRICHNVNRVCYIFGESVKHPVKDITTTTLTPHVIDVLREADHIATSELQRASYGALVSQMPIILIPIHFDREEALTRTPSCLRSVVIRTFITEDFMTGVPAIPNRQIPFKVSCGMIAQKTFSNICFVLRSFLRKRLKRFPKSPASLGFSTTSPPSRRAPLNGSRCFGCACMSLVGK